MRVHTDKNLEACRRYERGTGVDDSSSVCFFLIFFLINSYNFFLHILKKRVAGTKGVPVLMIAPPSGLF